MRKNLDPSVQEDLRIQEALATKQNANKKRTKDGQLILDPKVYGPSKTKLKAPAINMEEELSEFQKAGIIDEASKDFFMGKQPNQDEQTTEEEITEEETKLESDTIDTKCYHCQGTGILRKEKPLNDDEKFQLVYDDMMYRFGKAPSIADMKTWKQMHGAVFIMDLGDVVYMYRYLKRIEYKALLASDWQQWDDQRRQEEIVNKCLLWPASFAKNANALEGGLVETIAMQINHHSMFLEPAAVAQFTMKI